MKNSPNGNFPNGGTPQYPAPANPASFGYGISAQPMSMQQAPTQPMPAQRAPIQQAPQQQAPVQQMPVQQAMPAQTQPSQYPPFQGAPGGYPQAQKKKSNKALIIVTSILGVLAVAGIVFLLVFFLGRGSDDSSAESNSSDSTKSHSTPSKSSKTPSKSPSTKSPSTKTPTTTASTSKEDVKKGYEKIYETEVEPLLASSFMEAIGADTAATLGITEEDIQAYFSDKGPVFAQCMIDKTYDSLSEGGKAAIAEDKASISTQDATLLEDSAFVCGEELGKGFSSTFLQQ